MASLRTASRSLRVIEVTPFRASVEQRTEAQTASSTNSVQKTNSVQIEQQGLCPIMGRGFV
jgi:hypothetical protein